MCFASCADCAECEDEHMSTLPSLSFSPVGETQSMAGEQEGNTGLLSLAEEAGVSLRRFCGQQDDSHCHGDQLTSYKAF